MGGDRPFKKFLSHLFPFLVNSTEKGKGEEGLIGRNWRRNGSRLGGLLLFYFIPSRLRGLLIVEIAQSQGIEDKENPYHYCGFC
jgi:hypothetical protein